MLPKSWKKSFNNRAIIPVEMRGYNECKIDILCITCNIQIRENIEFGTNLGLLKRLAPNRFGYMLTYFKE